MSTPTTEVQSTLSTFQPEPRKYDLRTAEGKFWKRLDSYKNEYTVSTGVVSINQTRGYGDEAEVVAVPREAIHLVRTVDIDNDAVENYLKGQLKNDWSSREARKAVLVVVNEALVWEQYGAWQWSHVDCTVWSLVEDGEVECTTRTITDDYYDASRVVMQGLGNKVFEVTQANLVHAENAKKEDHRQSLIAQAHADFKPSYYFAKFKKNAEKYIAETESVSLDVKSLAKYDFVRDADNLAVRVVVYRLCQEFLTFIGKSDWEVSAPHRLDGGIGYDNLLNEAPAIIDERIAFAYTIASVLHDARESAVFGKAVYRFSEVLNNY